jgi:hypothetical protein
MTHSDLPLTTVTKESALFPCGPLGRGLVVVDCDHLTLSLKQGPFVMLTIV